MKNNRSASEELFFFQKNTNNLVKVKSIPVKNSFSDVRTVSRSLFRFQAVPFAVCNVLFTVCYSTIASRKNKGI
ncbi:hypothetical protein D4M40_15645 [Enterococcus faecalis]|nr:hypothetical protein HMPREF9520_02981 [Enterococcus faecalis TX1467]TXW21756.1 hypothetical protein D4M40_15645 [Enterococcus faecalis]